MNADGMNQVNLTNHPASDTFTACAINDIGGSGYSNIFMTKTPRQ